MNDNSLDITKSVLLKKALQVWEEQGARLHGNGFIQVDLEDGQRLHIWPHPLKPAQVVHTPIHDHRFSFVSTILAGAMYNRCFDLLIRPNGGLQIYTAEARAKEDTELAPSGVYADISPVWLSQVYTEGQSYEFPAFAFHMSDPQEFTITYMRKRKVFPTSPRVLVPRDQEPDNQWNRYSEDAYWREYVQRWVDQAFQALGAKPATVAE